MPVTKQPNGPEIITPAKQLNTLDGQISGSTRDLDFSITEYRDSSIQLQVDLSESLPGGVSVLKSVTGLSTTVVYTLPSASGQIALVGGGTTPSFSTIQTPNGTSPVATGPNDTLTLAEGTGITITGDATTDTVTIASAGITALTGDVTASGPGSSAATLATVNSNVGGFGTATQVATLTVNAKGLVTAASNTSIQIAQSQVTNLATDLAAKLTAANNLSDVANASTARTNLGLGTAATQAYQDSGDSAYSGTITWTGTTAPSGATNHRFRWISVGNLTTLMIYLNYVTAGLALTSVTLDLPSGAPTPVSPTGLGAADEVIYSGPGYLAVAKTTAIITGGRASMKVNAAANGYEIVVAGNSGSQRIASATISYFS